MSQYFDNVILPSEIKEFETKVMNINFKFKTDNGVFSKDRLDFGSRVLIESMPLEKMKGRILDLGCGYGAVSIILSKIISADSFFDAVDINKRALHLGEMNKKLNKVDNINFYESDVYENVTGKFNYIITNPPIRAGKDVLYKMLDGARNYLDFDGSLFFVMRKEHGAKSMFKHLSDIYNIDEVCKKNGFIVFRCKNK